MPSLMRLGPVTFFISAGQVSDYTGAAAVLRHLPRPIGCLQIAGMTPIGPETG